MNKGITSFIFNFCYSKLWNPILDWKESTRLTYCWMTHENPQVLQVLKNSEVLCSEYWRKVDIYCWKASCKFTLVTANTKVEGAVIGPKSQKRFSPHGVLGTAGIQLLNPWREWGLEKAVRNPTEKSLIFGIIPHIRGRSTLQEHTVLHQQQLDLGLVHTSGRQMPTEWFTPVK